MQAVPRQAGGHAQLQLSVCGRLQQPTIVELQRPRLHRNACTSYATSQETGKIMYIANYVVYIHLPAEYIAVQSANP